MDDPNLSEWDRFARQEYIRLAMEEDDGEDASGEGGEMWDDAAGGEGPLEEQPRAAAPFAASEAKFR